MKYKNLMPLNLQFFAEPPEGNDQEDPEAGKKDPEDKPSENDPKPQSFDDLLKDKSYQSEFDRRVQKALETQRTKYEALMDDKLSESEKLSKMTKEEKEQYNQQKREKELANKEASITKRELLADAKGILADKEMPIGLSEFLVFSDKQACEESIEKLSKIYAESVAKGIEAAIKGGKTMKKAPGEEDQKKNEEERVLRLMRGN